MCHLWHAGFVTESYYIRSKRTCQTMRYMCGPHPLRTGTIRTRRQMSQKLWRLESCLSISYPCRLIWTSTPSYLIEEPVMWKMTGVCAGLGNGSDIIRPEQAEECLKNTCIIWSEQMKTKLQSSEGHEQERRMIWAELHHRLTNLLALN